MKMLRMCNLICGFCALLLVIQLAGCGAKSAPTTYYRLASLEKAETGARAEARFEVALGVGPLTVPEYLKKAQIATRDGATRYRFAEAHRWAGMIDKEMASVIGNNLGLLLGTDKIMYFPWQHNFKPDYRVAIEVIQFDSDLHGDALLSARWTLSDASGQPLAAGKSTYRQPLASASYDALVDAEGLLLGEFSTTLAGELKVFLPQR